MPVSFKGHTDYVCSVVFTPDSETFARASEDKMVCVWKRETGKIVLGSLKVGSQGNSVVYSPDGTKLAAETGEELLKIEQWAWQVAFTPNGHYLISGNWNDIWLSDVATREVIQEFDMHTKPFYLLAIALSGTKFTTTSYDKTIQFFDLTTLKPISKPFKQPEGILGLAFSEDSQLIVTGCEDKLVQTWKVPQNSPDNELPPIFFDDVHTNYPRRSNHLPYGVPQHAAQQSHIMALVKCLPFCRQSQQADPLAGQFHHPNNGAGTPGACQNSYTPNKVPQFLQQHLPFCQSIPSPGQPWVVDVAAAHGNEVI
ncbi:WD40 repeat-like protein [Suillus decipiens]|nr:WD40 repeat-like protein [Suillus decipiens]